jgi:hypothetical protein
VPTSLVLSTLLETQKKDPTRKCFRMIGGVLVERTVNEVIPSLQMNNDGVRPLSLSLSLPPTSLSLSLSLYLSHCLRTRQAYSSGPQLQIKQVLQQLIGQYKDREAQFETFCKENGIQRQNVQRSS